jgi:orotate phosphoribosyltransferase
LDAREQLLDALRTHGLVLGEVTLASGRTAQYYVDARRALLTAQGFRAAGELVAAEARRLGAAAVGGPTLGADPIACSVLCAAHDLKAFFVRKERKEHGLQRWIEGPGIASGERALVVEDVVTSGGSLVTAIERLHEEGVELAGALTVVDRLAGGDRAIKDALGADLPYLSLFTIDDVYPERPDKGNVAVVSRWADAFARGDIAEDLWDESLEIVNAEGWVVESTYRGHEGLRRWWHDLEEAFSDLTMEVDEISPLDDERILTAQRFVGHFRSTGIAFDGPWASVLTVRAGRIVRAVGYLSKRQALSAVEGESAARRPTD